MITIFQLKKKIPVAVNLKKRKNKGMDMENAEVIDGSVLEGGGQILRLSIALSSLTKKPVKIFNIRAKRSKPGLAAQHMKGNELAAKMCGGRLHGNCIGSTEIHYYPGNFTPGEYTADTQTAGSITLMFQIALPIALFGSSVTKLHLKGGTTTYMAPPIDYTTNIFRPILNKFGANFQFDIRKRGYFPKGGGYVCFTVHPVKSLSSVNLTDNGNISRLCGRSYIVGNAPAMAAKEMAEFVAVKMRTNISSDVPINILEAKEGPQESVGNGIIGISLQAETDTGCILGSSQFSAKDTKQERLKLAQSACRKLKESLETGCCVDEYTQDQILLFMALARGKSRIKCGPITTHAETVIYIVEKFLKVKFHIIREGFSNIIECEGIGFENMEMEHETHKCYANE